MPNYFKNGITPEERRRVLPGYPKDLVFKNYEEYKQYFVGDRITCLLCGKHTIPLPTKHRPIWTKS